MPRAVVCIVGAVLTVAVAVLSLPFSPCAPFLVAAGGCIAGAGGAGGGGAGLLFLLKNPINILLMDYNSCQPSKVVAARQTYDFLSTPQLNTEMHRHYEMTNHELVYF